MADGAAIRVAGRVAGGVAIIIADGSANRAAIRVASRMADGALEMGVVRLVSFSKAPRPRAPEGKAWGWSYENSTSIVHSDSQVGAGVPDAL